MITCYSATNIKIKSTRINDRIQVMQI